MAFYFVAISCPRLILLLGYFFSLKPVLFWKPLYHGSVPLCPNNMVNVVFVPRRIQCFLCCLSHALFCIVIKPLCLKFFLESFTVDEFCSWWEFWIGLLSNFESGGHCRLQKYYYNFVKIKEFTEEIKPPKSRLIGNSYLTI